jgi:biopolymer transport protein ExbD
MKLHQVKDTKLDVQISALIDIVFLLLIYFMVTAVLVKKEGDIAFQLPLDGVPIDLPIEVLIAISADGSVEVEGMQFSDTDTSFKALVAHVSGLKRLATSQQSEFFVSISPHQDTLHHRVIDVMDACAAAGVRQLGFSKSI